MEQRQMQDNDGEEDDDENLQRGRAVQAADYEFHLGYRTPSMLERCSQALDMPDVETWHGHVLLPADSTLWLSRLHLRTLPLRRGGAASLRVFFT
jgi:hypothetical protein